MTVHRSYANDAASLIHRYSMSIHPGRSLSLLAVVALLTVLATAAHSSDASSHSTAAPSQSGLPPLSTPTASLAMPALPQSTSQPSPRFWDTALRSNVIVSSDDQRVLVPGSDDEVRLIIQLRGEPLAAYLNHGGDSRRILQPAEADAIRRLKDHRSGER